MLKIGLTGGIASGKSTVLHYFKNKQIPFIDADIVAREVVAPGTEGLADIERLFGSTVINDDGTLNREALGAIVFHDPKERERLNTSIHGFIRNRIEELTRQFESQGVPVLIYDIPLLIEGKWYEILDTIWLVYVTPEVQLYRLMDRNGFTREEALARIDSQMPIDEKRQYADIIIDNTGDFASLQAQLDTLWHDKLQSLYV